MSEPSPDDATRSPSLLAGPPKRGLGVRRLNKMPLVFGIGISCAIAATIGYTIHERSVHAHGKQEEKHGVAGQAAVLSTAPADDMVAPTGTEIAPRHTASTPTTMAPTDHPAEASQDDEASKARRAAWQAYYQQLGVMQKQRYDGASSALRADASASNGFGAGAGQGGNASRGEETASVQADQPDAPQMDREPARGGRGSPGYGGGYAGGYGSGFDGGGYGGGAPVLPDTTGAREKQAFQGQRGSDGDIAKDTLMATVRDPISPYTITAGDFINCTMQGGAGSDTPGQVTGRITDDIYDSATGRYKLIPKDAKVIGIYDNVVSAGQDRLPMVIKRIIFPDSSSIDIGAMTGADAAGFAGLHDQVDRHIWEKFGNALILTAGAAGAQIASGGTQNSNGYNSQQIIAGSLGQQFGELGQEYARSGMSIPNTIRIRPGYRFTIQISKDMILRPYVDRRTSSYQASMPGPIIP